MWKSSYENNMNLSIIASKRKRAFLQSTLYEVTRHSDCTILLNKFLTINSFSYRCEDQFQNNARYESEKIFEIF